MKLNKWMLKQLSKLPVWPVGSNTGITEKGPHKGREFRVRWKEIFNTVYITDVRFTDEKPGEFPDIEEMRKRH